MTNLNHTYRLKSFTYAAIAWELIFWIGFYLLVNGLGVFSEEGANERLIFKAPSALYLLFLIIPLFGLTFIKMLKSNNLARTVGKAYHSYLPAVNNTRTFVRFFLLRNAFAFLILAMGMPAFGSKKTSGTAETLELTVCLDISNSMNTKDISKSDSRLDISKRALIQLINNLNGEKIGLCLFANDAFVQLPLTTDYAAAKMFINDIETSMIASQGTDIAEAFKISKDMFSNDKVTKGILLVTDGEDHEGGLDEILGEIKKEQIQVIALGIGTESGGLVPKDPNRPEIGYKTDATGRSVLSKLNKGLIREIASKSGGKANFSNEEFPNLSPLLTQLKQMKRTKIDNLDFDVKQEKYRVPLIVSGMFWILFFFWTSKSFQFINKFIEVK